MEEKKIKTNEMTRKIRDEHAKRLAGKSHAGRIAFYRERAKKMEKRVPLLLSKLAIASGGKGDSSRDRHVWLGNPNVDTTVRRIREKRGAYKKKK